MKKQHNSMKQYGLSLVKSAMVTQTLGRADHKVDTFLSLEEIANSMQIR